MAEGLGLTNAAGIIAQALDLKRQRELAAKTLAEERDIKKREFDTSEGRNLFSTLSAAVESGILDPEHANKITQRNALLRAMGLSGITTEDIKVPDLRNQPEFQAPSVPAPTLRPRPTDTGGILSPAFEKRDKASLQSPMQPALPEKANSLKAEIQQIVQRIRSGESPYPEQDKTRLREAVGEMRGLRDQAVETARSRSNIGLRVPQQQFKAPQETFKVKQVVGPFREKPEGAALSLKDLAEIKSKLALAGKYDAEKVAALDDAIKVNQEFLTDPSPVNASLVVESRTKMLGDAQKELQAIKDTETFIPLKFASGLDELANIFSETNPETRQQRIEDFKDNYKGLGDADKIVEVFPEYYAKARPNIELIDQLKKDIKYHSEIASQDRFSEEERSVLQNLNNLYTGQIAVGPKGKVQKPTAEQLRLLTKQAKGTNAEVTENPRTITRALDWRDRWYDAVEQNRDKINAALSSAKTSGATVAMDKIPDSGTIQYEQFISGLMETFPDDQMRTTDRIMKLLFEQ